MRYGNHNTKNAYPYRSKLATNQHTNPPLAQNPHFFRTLRGGGEPGITPLEASPVPAVSEPQGGDIGWRLVFVKIRPCSNAAAPQTRSSSVIEPP